MPTSHRHPHTEELHVFFVPADPELPMEMKVIPNHWTDMARLIGGYLEMVRGFWPSLDCGCSIVMIVDEEGLLKQLPRNTRLPDYGELIVGDAFFALDAGPHFASLPPEFHHWEGPGKPYPAAAQPWSE